MRFFTSVFFHQNFTPWTLIHILNFFEFGFKFTELFEFEFDSLLHHAAGSQISPLHDAAGSHGSPLHDATGSHVSPLHHAVGSQSMIFW